MMNNGRDRWGARSVFLLAAIGSAVGLGNIWRYPHVAYAGGGGAFLVPYFIALLTAGIPLLMLEFGLGHKMQSAAPGSFRQIHRRFEIPGWWAAFGGLFITFYYTIVMAWVCFYLFRLGEVVVTGADQLPWEAAGPVNYLLHDVVNGSPDVPIGEGEFSRINTWALGFNALVWGFIYYAIRNGVKSVGKVVWVTVFLPYVFLFILFFTAIGLDGASAGLNFYLAPDWSKYCDPVTGDLSITRTLDIASKAYGQIFFSLSIGFGIMIAYASFLPKRSDIANNSLITAFANSATEFFGGIITFCVLGFLAVGSGQFTGDVVGSSSLMIAFNAYPAAIANVTSDVTTNALIGMAFFGCLFFLGIDSAFSLVEAIVAGITDKFRVPRKLVAALFCLVGWLVGVIYCTPAGLILFDAADHYLSEYGLLLIGLIQCIAVGWVFGAKNMRAHINSVSERRITPFWDVCIKYITPIMLLVILVGNFMHDIERPYEGYGMGTQMFGISMVVVSLVLGILLATRKGSQPVSASIEVPKAQPATSPSPTPPSSKSTSGTLGLWLCVAAIAIASTTMAAPSEQPEATPAVATGTANPAERAKLLTMPALLDAVALALAEASPPVNAATPLLASRTAAIAEATALFTEIGTRAAKQSADHKLLNDWARDGTWVGPWAARIGELHASWEVLVAMPAPNAEAVLAEATKLGYISPPDTTNTDTPPSTPIPAPAAETVAIWTAIILQREIDTLLTICGPTLKHLPDTNAVLHLIDPAVMFREPTDLRMIQPHKPVTGADRDQLLREVRRFALRYPAGKSKDDKNTRVANAWAARDNAAGVIARIGTDPHGIPERTLCSYIVEDMRGVWNGRVPAELIWRKNLVRPFSNQTSLTSPGNSALIMLLAGSVVLFGGLAWALYVARRGRPDDGDEADLA